MSECLRVACDRLGRGRPGHGRRTPSRAHQCRSGCNGVGCMRNAGNHGRARYPLLKCAGVARGRRGCVWHTQTVSDRARYPGRQLVLVVAILPPHAHSSSLPCEDRGAAGLFDSVMTGLRTGHAAQGSTSHSVLREILLLKAVVNTGLASDSRQELASSRLEWQRLGAKDRCDCPLDALRADWIGE